MKTVLKSALLSLLFAFFAGSAFAQQQVGGGSGSVSVTAASPCLLINPTPGTGTFTVAATVPINAQTGTSYPIVSGDLCKIVTFSNAGAIAATIPQATGTFGAGAALTLQNIGVGSVTLTPTTSTVNGAATLAIPQNTGCTLVSDGTNWQVSDCVPAAGIIGSGSFVRAASAQGNGTKVQLSTSTTTTNDCVKFDANGNTVDAGAACGGAAGTVTTTGSPANGNLTKFTGAATISNGDLSGDCTTSGALAVTCLKTNGVSFTSAATTAIGTSGATIPLLNTTNTWGALQKNCTTTLSVVGSGPGVITPDGTCNNYVVTLVHAACPCTFANPSVDITGGDGRIQIIQSSTGGDTISTWGSNYRIAGNTSTITLSSAANAKDLFSIAGISSTEDDLVGPSLNLVH
jgi:hypothetical protein